MSQLPTLGTPLTGCEIQVLALVAQGMENGQIARRLFLGTPTVKTHIRRLLAKLGARDRAHAVALAFRAGTFDADFPEIDLYDRTTTTPRKAER